MTITVDPAPPILKLPESVLICLDKASLPGTVHLRWDNPEQLPTELELDNDHPCRLVEIPDGTVGLQAQHNGSPDVTIV